MGNSSSNRKSRETLCEAPRPSPEENEYLYLARFDTVLIVDDSGSMKGEGRWRIAGEALAELAYVAAQYDGDGIEIQFLNNPIVKHGLKTKEEIKQLFESITPEGLTPIGSKLDGLITAYIAEYKKLRHTDQQPKPVNYILLTDGVPTDSKPLTPEEVIVEAAKALDEIYAPQIQVGIQFVQVGADANATRYLQGLDDTLKHKYDIRDIVDTTPARAGHDLDGQDMIKILTGGINRRVDNEERAKKNTRSEICQPVVERFTPS
ncbi:hypothetical protein EDD18DRAFT_808331 [Armillaria luteobubalina]|uniref:VWFA domain-containing protein n=1 Tax=Armillaria luteobubalina TaxID=153913 RepID=A0AA39QBP2_9AGAR|nr:hypothetical protein EDD18DRAFT_808331 [Armillaria luteobubalina]